MNLSAGGHGCGGGPMHSSRNQLVLGLDSAKFCMDKSRIKKKRGDVTSGENSRFLKNTRFLG